MILVTGGTGFVGPHVVHALRAREEPVRCLVRDRSRGRQLESWGCELVEGDVTDAASLARAVEGCDTVVHLVAILLGKPAEFERVMIQGTRDLVAAVENAGVRRFVLMSALGASEEKDLVPYYGAKYAMERTVEASAVEHVIFRPSFVFGRDGGSLPTFVRIVKLSPITPVPGSGEQRIQPIWVEDVAAFFAEAVRKPEAGGRTFELGGPDVVSWNELYERIARTLGKRRRRMHLPIGLMRVQAAMIERLPIPLPLSRDTLKMLEGADNTCDVGPAVETFGLPLVPLDEQLRRGVG